MRTKLLTPGRLAAAGAVLAVAVVAALFLTPSSSTYIFLPDRAHPVEPLVEVEGGQAPRDGGGIFFVDIIVRQATVLERLLPAVREEGSELVPAHRINPTRVPEDERRRRNLREMRRSQVVAGAVALRELGYDVKAKPTGALVTDVLADAPASGKLKPDDVLVGVGDERVRSPQELRRLLTRRDPGATVSLRVRREGRVRRVSIRTVAAPDEPARPVIGVLVDQAADVDLPLSVKIDSRGVGGPSAGLAFALDVLEELGRDVDRGQKVAVTGALALDGDVLPIGGVRQKTVGVKRADVDVFVVPAGENAVEARRYAGDVQIIPVKTFQQALQKLATLKRK